MTTPATSPLRLPVFRAIWIASLCSNFGGMIQSVGASWMMTSLSGSPRMIALVQTSTSLPIVLLSLWAGAIADNLDRCRVMLATQVFMLSVSLLLSVGAWFGVITPWLLLAFTFLIGCGAAINGPAWQASVGDIVSRPMLSNAVALNGMGFNIARSAGPAIGGAIVAAAGSAAAFLCNAASYVALIVVLKRWRPDLPPRRLPRERLGVAMIAGVRYVRLSPQIRVILLRALLFGIGASALPALMPLVARDLLGGGPFTYGILLGSFGAGAVGGAVAGGRLRGRLSVEGIVRVSSIGLAVGAMATAFVSWLPLTLPALAVAGASWVIALSSFNVSVQMASPRWVVARTIALYQMAVFGGMATGSWLFGSVAGHYGVVFALASAGAYQMANLIAGLLFRLPAISELDLTPSESWQEPSTALPVEPRSGPIVITVEHRIAEADIAAFLTIMSERRRIRSRDGARDWSLLRDLAEPTLWVERFDFATWLEYVRHNERRTKADQANSDALYRIWIDGTKPVIHRQIERQTGSLPTDRGLDAMTLDPITDASRAN